VRFICFEIFATGVLAFECFRNSACIAFVHATFVRFTFFAILFSAFYFRPLSAARFAAVFAMEAYGRASMVTELLFQV
jgi:hypothetical protein